MGPLFEKVTKLYICFSIIFSSMPVLTYAQVSNTMLEDQWFIIPPERASSEQHLNNFMNLFTTAGAFLSLAGIASAFEKPQVLRSLKLQGRNSAISRAIVGYIEGSLTITSVGLMAVEFNEILGRINQLCMLREKYQPSQVGKNISKDPCHYFYQSFGADYKTSKKKASFRGDIKNFILNSAWDNAWGMVRDRKGFNLKLCVSKDRKFDLTCECKKITPVLDLKIWNIHS